MDTLKGLREKRSGLEAKIKAILASADEDNEGVLTDEQQTEIAEAETEIDKLTASIDMRERHAYRAQAGAEPAGRRVPVADPGIGASRIEVGETLLDPACGYTHVAQFAIDVHAACQPGTPPPQRLTKAMEIARKLDGGGMQAAPSDYHREGMGQDGGYMVPPSFSQEIWDGVYNPDDEDIINWIGPEPTESNVVGMLRDEWTPWGSTGVQAYWRAEAAQMSATKSVTKTVNMTLHELYAFVLATDELLEDAPRLNARLTKQASAAIKWKASDALVKGTGAGTPKGWEIDSGVYASIAKESSQTADTINAANATKMYGALLGLNSRCFWLINPDAFNQVPQMTIGEQPIWTPPVQGLKGVPTGTLLGLPIHLCEHCETLGDLFDIQLINPDGYYCAVKSGGVRAASSMHLYFDYAVTAFRWMFRIGGQSIMSAYVTPANSTVYQSHFVALAARA